MRVVENTSSRLTLEDRPRFLAGFLWFMGLLCLFTAITGKTEGLGEAIIVPALGVMTCGIAHYFFPFQRITFDRTNARMTRVLARLTGRKVTSYPLHGIRRAKLQAQWSESSRLERLALEVDTTTLPLEFGYSSASRADLVELINTWLSADPD